MTNLPLACFSNTGGEIIQRAPVARLRLTSRVAKPNPRQVATRLAGGVDCGATRRARRLRRAGGGHGG